MRVLHFDSARTDCAVYAVTQTDEPGPCVITWVCDDDPCPGEQCDGWIEGDILFAPADGTDTVGRNLLQKADGYEGTVFAGPEFEEFDLLPDPRAHWYDVATGQTAIVGLPGSPLAIFA
jgi:hypothetical protein